MAIYKYTLPSGARYTVNAPEGTTQAQADYAFYSQVASGSLVGYTRGQTLSNFTNAVTKFELSRLDRDTAGVDSSVTLAITLPSNNIPLKNPVTTADIVAVGGAISPVGTLTLPQTAAVIAQISNLVDQPADEISTDLGIGEYGLDTPQLEQAGYLKPGTSNYPDFNCAVSSPSVWTGKDGVYSLTDVLNDPSLQTQMQTQVMQNSYNALTASGTIPTTTTAPGSALTGQVYTSNGLTTLTAAGLVTGVAALNGSLNQLVSTTLAGATNIGNLLSSPVTNISTLASGAVTNVTQGIAGLGTNALSAANNLVNTSINGTIGSVTGLANNAVGALVANASQFTAPVTALWAQGSRLVSGAQTLASGLTGSFNGLTGTFSGLSSSVTSGLGGLTTLASGALTTIQDQAQTLLTNLGASLDVFGKMSSFSVDFSLFSSDSLVSPTKVAAGYSNTVNRQTVDAAVTRILGNSKIPAPIFEYPSPGALNVGADVTYAQNALKNLAGQATGAFNNATNFFG
jgi:hypothetical protein